MRPENVSPKNFKVKKILYDNKDFSIAIGQWQNKEEKLAMRWNGGDGNLGYPTSFGNPVWFLVHEELTNPIIKSLLGKKNANNNNVLEALKNSFAENQTENK